jgi:MoaA/NifB/PqqE/SkfB family radical SAM enzyme
MNGTNFNKVECLVGFKCNCNCIFCSFGDHIQRAEEERHHGIKTFEEIKKDIDFAASIRANVFAFSGGEPTIRKDIFKIVEYAKTQKIPNLEIQSNGRLFYYRDYCEEMIDSGINDFVVSLHSNKEGVHDKLMGSPGTFRQTVRGIRNLKELNQRVKINVVINKLNYRDLTEVAKFLITLGIDEIRFVFITVEGSVNKNPKTIVPTMTEATPFLHKALDFALKKVPCYVYNVPLCFMNGYESTVVELTQADTQLRGPGFEVSIGENRRKLKVKSDVCKDCRHNSLCQGVWINYANVFGLGELKPVR